MARKDHQVLVNQPGAQFKTRLPESLHDRIKVAAALNKRSATQELVARLEASFRPTSQTLDSAVAKAITAYVDAEVQRRLREIASQIGGA